MPKVVFVNEKKEIEVPQGANLRTEAAKAGIEIYKGRPIFYSLGNFIFQNETVAWVPYEGYQRFGLGPEHTPGDYLEARSDAGKRGFPSDPVFWRSVVAVCTYEGNALKEITLYPIDMGFGRPIPQRGRPVLATNTSGLPLDELAEALSYPQRFLAMHFFMPADVFPMIEVVRGVRTEDAAVAVALAAVKRAGREPILLQRAVNGYLINRLQHSILHEAYHLIEDGIATPEMIDKVAKRLLGPRMCITGLVEQKDIAGLGMHAQAQRSIVPTLSHTNIPSPYLQNMVARGDVGIRSGKGFYDWGQGADGKGKSLWPELSKMYPTKPDQPEQQELIDRLMFAQANEAARCYEEKVLRSVADANIGSIMGIGFPPWTGGSAQYIVGYPGGKAGFVARAKELAAKYGDRFNPPDSLTK
jgi:3-hydroxyacyl-CoA dehydrogenase